MANLIKRYALKVISRIAIFCVLTIRLVLLNFCRLLAVKRFRDRNSHLLVATDLVCSRAKLQQQKKRVLTRLGGSWRRFSRRRFSRLRSRHQRLNCEQCRHGDASAKARRPQRRSQRRHFDGHK